MRTFIIITFLCGTAFASSVLKVTKLSDESISASPYNNTLDESGNYEEETISSTKINPKLLKALNFNYEPIITEENEGPLSIENKNHGENKEFLVQVEETSDISDSNPSKAPNDDEIPKPTNVLPQEKKQEANETYKPPIEHSLENNLPKPPELPEFDLVEFVKNQKLNEFSSTTPHYDKPQSTETYLWTPETPKPETFRGFPNYDSKPQNSPSFLWASQDVSENKGKLLHVPPPPTLPQLDYRFLLQKLGEVPTLKENDLQLPESTHPETYLPPTSEHTSDSLDLFIPNQKLIEPKYKPEFLYPPQPQLPQPSLPIKRTEFYPNWQIPGLAKPSFQPAIDSSSWPGQKPELPPQKLPERKPELPYQRTPYRPDFIRCDSEPYPSYDIEHFQTYPNDNHLYNPTIQTIPAPTLPPFKYPEPAYPTEIPPLENYEEQSQVYKNIPPSPTLPPFKWGLTPNVEIVPSTEKPKLSTPKYIPPSTSPTPETTTTPETKLPTITVLPTVTVVPNIVLPQPSKPPAEISPHKENNPHHHHHKHQEHNPDPCTYVLLLKKKCPKH